MTNLQNDPLADVLSLYAEHPLADGDAILLLDGQVCMEVEGLADHWDEALRLGVTEAVRATARSVTLAVARHRERLRDGDYQIWRELHAGLRDADINVAPLRALPAA